jgi:hypothetical protein
MQDGGLLDFLPIWVVFPATAAIVLLAIEAGFRIGQYQRRRSEQEDKPPISEVVSASLALLAFMLAFTFGLAAARFDTRRALVIDEANAIGTTFLRAGFLAEPDRTEVRALLREYVDVRLEAVQPGKLITSLRRSEALQTKLWVHAVAVGEKNPNSIVVGLFINSLNEVIDFHSKRVALGVRNRIPGTIWAALYFVTIIGTAVMGFHSGIASSRRSVAILAVILAFSAVTTLIMDLDRPQQGFLRVSQQSMVDLQRSLQQPSR